MSGSPIPTLADIVFPSRDETIARVVERLSEPTQSPRGDNFVSNEDSYPRVAAELARRARLDSVYLGVGPDQNFTLLAHARPVAAFVVDYRRRNLLVHVLHKALFSLADDRIGYLARLTARDPGRLPEEPSPRALIDAFATAPFDPDRLARATAEVAALARSFGIVREAEWAELATIQARLAGPGLAARFLALPMYPTLARLIATTDAARQPAHVLASETRYREVRDRQRSDRIVPLVADFAGSTGLARLAGWLRERGLRIGTLYISDVEFFLLRAGRWDAYVANLGRLPWHDDAVIVRTSTREIDHPARIAGDSSTTVLVEAARFLADARAGRIRSVDDLFPH